MAQSYIQRRAARCVARGKHVVIVVLAAHTRAARVSDARAMADTKTSFT